MAPQAEIRQKAAEVVGNDRFLVAHCSAPIEWCREQDEKGIYAKAEAGEIANVTGVSIAYETPENPDIVLPLHESSVEECAQQVISLLEERGVI